MEDNAELVPPASSKVLQRIPVHISYEIIRLFSEGLYQSPHKAVEELVSNGYDAGATAVHVILPQEPDNAEEALQPLWVLDNGHGMDTHGFQLLWQVAHSTKGEQAPAPGDRPPIGQFGIGKLAAYVLARRLVHISKSDGCIRMTVMNFRDIEGLHQYEDSDPFGINLYEVTELDAKEFLRDIEQRDPVGWSRLFGPKASRTWTAAALEDFKNLYERLSAGRLAWVLRTGLPLQSNFQIWQDGARLEPAKEGKNVIKTVVVGAEPDTVAESLDLTAEGNKVHIAGIRGPITGTARVFEDRLTTGKSTQYGRSHGFFVRVRGRVVNLEDELFGLDALNHAAWSRFSMEIDADGLREHLLSSREGVRESRPTDILRRYLHGVFNLCRKAFNEWERQQLEGLDIDQLLSDSPSVFVTEPLIQSVHATLRRGSESFYISKPQLREHIDPDAWLETFESDLSDGPFKEVLFEKSGEYDRALRYIPETRTLVMNSAHPFVDKLLAGGRHQGVAILFGTSELLTDVLMQDHGLEQSLVLEFLRDRDKVLRLLAGDEPPTAGEILRKLRIANRDETALERAVGLAFRVLGFEYERRGGSKPGPDGVLYARLGRDTDALADYKLVYDAKQTSAPNVAADKINLASIDKFRDDEGADYAFFVATAYAAEDDPKGKLNGLVESAKEKGTCVTLLKIEHLQRLIELHYRFGVTLTDLRELFQNAHTIPEVEKWVVSLEGTLSDVSQQIPMHTLLEALEKLKHDKLARPNVKSARSVTEELRRFSPERLISCLRAVETLVGKRWIEVERSGDVRLHHNVDQVTAELERNIREILGPTPGIDAAIYPGVT